MSSFYTNFFLRGNTMYLRRVDNGIKSMETHELTPSLFVPSKKASIYKDVRDRPLERRDFDSAREARDFIKQYKDTGFTVCGYPRFEYVKIHELFPGDGVTYDPTQIVVANWDIETRVSGGFPNVDTADQEILLITIAFNGEYHFFSAKDANLEEYEGRVTKHIYPDEASMLRGFLEVWQANYPDVATGWNTNGFDFPYTFNRMKRVLGEKTAKKLSPFGIVEIKKVDFKGRETYVPFIAGIALLDYIELYQKFELSPREDYKLDTIAYIELGEHKLAYDGSFEEHYTEAWDHFCKYNVIDVELVEKLDRAKNFLQVAYNISYAAKINFNDVYRVTRVWDNLIALYLWDQNIHVVSDFRHEGDGIEGAFVKPTIPGLYEWIASFDVASLYPSLMIQYNISPDTMLDPSLFPELTPQDVIERNQKFKHAIDVARSHNATLCSNGSMYTKEKQGFVPILTDKFFQKRKSSKKEMQTYERELQRVMLEIERRGLK